MAYRNAGRVEEVLNPSACKNRVVSNCLSGFARQRGALTLGDENGDRKRDNHSEEEPEIATLLTERIGLKDGQPLVADRKQVAPLFVFSSRSVAGTKKNGARASPLGVRRGKRNRSTVRRCSLAEQRHVS